MTVTFNDHIGLDRVAGMVGTMMAYGNVLRRASDRNFSIEIFRRSKLPKLKDQLVQWERHGFLSWSADQEISG
jgi:hypothetical protein